MKVTHKYDSDQGEHQYDGCSLPSVVSFRDVGLFLPEFCKMSDLSELADISAEGL